MSKYTKYVNNRFSFNLLFFLLLVMMFSCKNENVIIKEIVTDKESVKNDTVIFSVKFNEKMQTGFSFANTYFYNDYIEFINNDSVPTVITKNISKHYENQIVKFLGFSMIHGKMTNYRHYYLLDKNNTEVHFEFDKGDVLLNESKGVFSLDKLFKTYKETSSNRTQKDSDKLHKIDSLYISFKEKYTLLKEPLLIKLNEYHYFNTLQNIDPLNPKIDTYIEKIAQPLIAGDPLNTLIYFYVKNRIDTFDFNTLNTQNHSAEYIELLSIGMFNFLRHEDHKGDAKYRKAIDWLKSTTLYQNDSIYMKKEITPLDNKKFQQVLKKLKLYGIDFESINFDTVLDHNPSEYYLIDFWATWCAPCIEGAILMKEMDIPKNIKIISLSIDKDKVREKWRNNSKKLNQEISYLIAENENSNKDFLAFITLQSIPRYILIDKDMNLIDEAFSHPQEPQFLSKLKDIKYAKYW